MIKPLKLFCVLLILSWSSITNAALITHEIIIDPYQVCFDGTDCSDISSIENGDLESYADNFFSAVGIDIKFSALNILNFDSSPSTTAPERFWLYPDEAGLGTNHEEYTRIPAFFEFAPSESILGIGWLGSAGVLVNLTSTYVDNMVTFIHEIGHNLGLEHYFDFGVGATDNFMDYTACGHACTIAPEQITQIRQSIDNDEFAFVHALNITPPPIEPVDVPEPSSLVLIILSLLLFRGFIDKSQLDLRYFNAKLNILGLEKS